MDVMIRVAGKYNDAKGNVAQYEEGEFLDTIEWYGTSLIESELAYPTESEGTESEPEGLEPGQETASVSVADLDKLDDIRELPKIKEDVDTVAFDEDGEEVDFSEIVTGLSVSMAQVLVDNGYHTKEQLKEASKAEILALPGVGAGTWNKIESWQESME